MKRSAPTIKEIAKNLNISVSTVSKALHNHPSIGLTTKERVQKLARELNYVPNQAAIQLRKQKSSIIGVILPTLIDQFFTLTVNGIEDYALKNNYNVFITQSHESLTREKELVDIMQRAQVDGVIVAVSKETTSYDHFNALEKAGIPVVYFVRQPKGVMLRNWVSCNGNEAAAKAVDFLVAQGHRRIAHLKGPDSLLTSEHRYEGYKDALLRNNIAYNADLIKVCDLTKAGTQKAMKELLQMDQPPTAVLCFKDYMVLDAMQFLRKQSPTNKKKMEFIGFGNLPMFEYFDEKPLASLDERPYKIGEQAIVLLLKLMNGPKEEGYQNINLECELIEY
ncbi:LacI family DNA-binding transcriptional regulator [Solitalea koreensis]|uniref:Transcriptional regulator, LacI family n=1 Tax=Solitalea koreensis TaxID=543615 RepID=A0A521CMX8_9SPHI|nr:LacI family DNA-binding transcriptional regulator [Solitalea koreensis]SMO60111.1 transcriptional regulator, LacI family [Solitalea koreensis]